MELAEALKRIEIPDEAQSDITKAVGIDAVVCPTNYTLIPDGHSVDYKIHLAAGTQLNEACLALHGCPIGGAVCTDSFDLRTRNGNRLIIHTVGPKGHRMSRIAAREALSGCYRNALTCAAENGCGSIVFPCIPLGHKGYARQEQARIAVSAITGWLMETDSPIRIQIRCRERFDRKEYRRLLENPALLKEEKDERIGLILSGGGAKGAFEVGVWRALEEKGLTGRITGISGTSIGALNTYLFASPVDIKHKEDVWYQINKKALLAGVDREMANIDRLIGKFEFQLEDDPSWQQLDLYSTVTNWNPKKLGHLAGMDRQYVRWNELPVSKIQEIVKDSARHLVIYNPKITHSGVKLDGGTLEAFRSSMNLEMENTNTPVQPLYDIGYRKFIVVYLNPFDEKTVEQLRDEALRYGDADFCRIFPEGDLGSIQEISTDVTRVRMQLGYDAALQELAQQEDGSFAPRWWSRP